jgi:hypothetical protein
MAYPRLQEKISPQRRRVRREMKKANTFQEIRKSMKSGKDQCKETTVF